MPLCIGTSLAVIIPTSFASFAAHHRRGAVDIGVLKTWALPIVAGVVGGSILAHYAPPILFKLVFVIIALLTAARLVWSERLPRLGLELPSGGPLAGYGVMIGASSSLMGIGGGLLGNIVMSMYGRPIHQTIATCSGIGLLVSLPGTLGYVAAGWNTTDLPPLSLGFVSLIALVLLTPTSVVTARWGVALAHLLTKRRLELALACYLFLISARFVISL